MSNELHLDESYGTALTPKDRNAIIGYCISIGTRAKCATARLLRPFKQKYLTAAMREMKLSHLKNIAETQEKIRLYNIGELKLSDEAIEFFGGEPTEKQLLDYFHAQIKQEREVMRTLSKAYTVNVDYSYLSKKQREFHNSLNPRVTFGYSSLLHEECDFELTSENKRAFLDSSLKDLPAWKEDWTHDWGYVFFESVINLLYEDLSVFCGDRRILDTISHEHMMTVDFTDEELEGLDGFVGSRSLIKKLKKLC